MEKRWTGQDRDPRDLRPPHRDTPGELHCLCLRPLAADVTLTGEALALWPAP
jgi:hypothetical protein